jgi:hypothetical protein
MQSKDRPMADIDPRFGRKAPFPWFGDQQHRERLWASPHCLHPERSVEKQDKLFA